MTLDEFIRKHCFQTDTNLRASVQRIRELSNRMTAEVTQSDQLRTGLEEARSRADEAERKLRLVRAALERLHERESELKQATSTGQSTASQLGREQERIQKRVVKIAHDRGVLIQEKKRLEQRRHELLGGAFLDYLSEVEKKLANCAADHEARSAKLRSQKMFDEARHREHEVMNLYEQRVELQRLLEQASVPVVRAQLQEALRECESQIDRRFPGALAGEEQRDLADESFELFFRGQPGRTHAILLPVSQRTWDEIAETSSSEHSAAARSALRLVWALAKWLASNGVDLRSAGATSVGGARAMLVHADLSTLQDSPVMPLPGAGEVSLSLAKLPEEIEVALHYEG